jgi:hypothetical protein
METTTTKRQFIIDIINDMDEETLIQLNNTYCQSINASDDEVWENSEENLQLFFNNNILNAIQATQYGNYNYHDKYCRFNGYGNLDSFNHFDVDDLYELVETIAEHIEENESEFEHIIDFTEFEA